MRSVLAAAAAAVEVGPGDGSALVERFDQAWRSGTPPRIEEFLARLRPDDTETPRHRLLQEFIKIDLEYRWQQAEEPSTPRDIGGPPPGGAALPARPRLEDYMACFPELGPAAQLPLELIGEEYWVRQRWGDRPALSEYAVRFAAHGPRLEEFLAQLDQQLAAEGPPPPRLPAPPGPATPLVCPHCHHPMPMDAGPLSADCTCPACGGRFRVEGRPAGPCASVEVPFARVGRYELKAQLGVGTFGSVWRAWDTELAREVAVKLPRCGVLIDPHEEERFLREARATAQLQHPQIVAVHDVGRDQHTIYLVADLVHGVSLAQWLRQGRLSVHQAADLVTGVADALDYAHRHGVVHRDLKPSNIMLESGAAGDTAVPAYGLPRVMDFGLAKREAGEITLTLEGQVLGTPAYMSPEQIRNPHAVAGRSDLYSLGVILYELLTGDLLFRGVLRMVLEQVQQDEPRPPRRLNDKIPRDLETITLKCLAKEPERRYRSAGALAAELRRWLGGEPIEARPVGRGERLQRWARHRPALATLAVVLFLIVAVGFPSATWLWRRAEDNFQEATRLKTEAQIQAQTAEQQLQDLRQSLDLYLTHLTGYQLNQGKGEPQAQLKMLEAERQYFERVLQQRPEDIIALGQLVPIYEQLARMADTAGPSQKALDLYQKACLLQGQLIQSRPRDAFFQNYLAALYNLVGVEQRELGLLAEALASHERARTLATRLVSAYPEVHYFRSELARTWVCLGLISDRASRFAQLSTVSPWLPSQPMLGVWYSSATAAVRLYEKGCDLGAECVEAAPANVVYRRCLGESSEYLGDTWGHLGRWEPALAAYQEAVRHQRLALARQPENARYLTLLATHYSKLERAQRELGRPAEAVASLLESAKLQPKQAASLYRLACEVAKCIPLVGRRPGMLTMAEQVERDQYADLALEMLQRAVRHGYQDLAQLQHNADFEPLRARADFQKLLAAVEAKLKPGAK